MVTATIGKIRPFEIRAEGSKTCDRLGAGSLGEKNVNDDTQISSLRHMKNGNVILYDWKHERRIKFTEDHVEFQIH